MDFPGIRRFRAFRGEILIEVGGDLWATDGTAAGTREILLGFDEVVTSLYVVDESRLFFRSREPGPPSQGSRLWVLDSIGGSPTPVPLPQNGEAAPTYALAASPDSLLFVAATDAHGPELWKTDGGPPRRLTNLAHPDPFPNPLFDQNIWTDGETTWFATAERLPDHPPKFWRVGAGPESQVEVFPGCPFPDCDLFAGTVGRVGDVFQMSGRFTAGGPVRFWISDGNPGGHRPLTDYCTTPCSHAGPVFGFDPDWRVFFGSNSSTFETSTLYLTDGTLAGTRPLARPNLNVESVDLFPAFLPPNAWVFGLSALDKGMEPWINRGDPSTTRLLLDIARSAADAELEQLVASESGLVFTAEEIETGDFFRRQVYRLSQDGTAERLTELDSSAGIRLASTGEQTFFIEGGNRLWKLGQELEDSLPLLTVQGQVFKPIAWQGKSVFTVGNGSDAGLWETDGAPSGSRRFFPQEDSYFEFISPFVRGADSLYFVATRPFSDPLFWQSDGTLEGTAQREVLGSALRSSSIFPLGVPASLGETDFVYVCHDVGQEVWKLPSPPAAAEAFSIPGPPTDCGSPLTIIPAGGRLLLLTGGDDEPVQLWAVDPVTGSVQELAEGLRPLSRSAPEIAPVSLGAVFTLTTEELGNELWVSDGTGSGTLLLRDLLPLQYSSNPSQLTAVDGLVYFTARDRGHGEELWVTDGTEAGTRLVHDVFPGAQGSSPEQLTVVGDKLYFTADDGLTGRELWVLPLDGGAPCRASDEALCLQGDRFRVEARWRNFRDEEGTGQAVELTQDTGYFWFFNEQNVEAVLKVLDGRANNDHFWSFYGALSNVEYWLTVTDTETGLTRRYYNPLRNFASVGDTFSFGPQGASLRSSPDLLEASPSPLPEVILSQAAPGTAGACAPSSERLCVNGGRFAVEVSWEKPNGETGTGKAVDLTDDTGYFWFFRDTNVELILKVLDGTANNGNYWVFYGSLSNVDFDVTVTDTETGEVRTYLNRGREFASVGDTEAFIVP